jgi:hypothetical protein
MYNSSIALNEADSDANGSGVAGGLYNANGQTLNVRNILAARNYRSSSTAQATDCGGPGLIHTYGRALFGTFADCTLITGTGFYTNFVPLSSLGPLAQNGGSTPTHALLVGSNAIDGADPALGCIDDLGLIATDQRGAARAQGAFCDVGAMESEELFFDDFESGDHFAWLPLTP